MSDRPTPYDEQACHSLLFATIRKAVEDVDLRMDSKIRSRNDENRFYQQTAIEFLRSPLFRSLCLNLRLPADKILRAAFQ